MGVRGLWCTLGRNNARRVVYVFMYVSCSAVRCFHQDRVRSVDMYSRHAWIGQTGKKRPCSDAIVSDVDASILHRKFGHSTTPANCQHRQCFHTNTTTLVTRIYIRIIPKYHTKVSKQQKPSIWISSPLLAPKKKKNKKAKPKLTKSLSHCAKDIK